jgi:mannose-1-phosphate guanylyltransferase
VRWAVVLAGGVGSRFWPLSTAVRPKQLLPLAGARPLIAESVARVLPLVPAERVLVVTSRALAPAIARALPELPAENVLAEPLAASTAPALAWATALAERQDPEAVVLSLHADWTVRDAEAFRAAAAAALSLASERDVVVTVGAQPTRPEAGYGYIVGGDAIPGTRARRIARFVEKPTLERARALIAEGAAWNTGLFAWTARRFRAEIEAHTPELAAALPRLAAGVVEGFYRGVKPVSVDVGVFERTARGATLSADFGWDDVGSWAALARVRPCDGGGNVAAGDARAVDTRDSVLWAEDGTIVAFGVEGLVIVRAAGITLVTTTERAAGLKQLLDALPGTLTGERGV